MKKNKNNYSLTAKQRKQQRNGELESPTERKKTLEQMSEEEQAEHLQAQLKRATKRKRIIQLVAITVAAVLALGSITTGTVLLIKANIIDNMKVNPIATITLDNNGVEQKLEMELYYKDAPAAVANFIYLSESGFFNDTMFNATSQQQRFLAMSGYTSSSTHRARETEFVSNLKGFKTHTGNSWGKDSFKLSYRIKQTQSNDPGPLSRKGYISFLGGREGNYSSGYPYATSTTFMIMGNTPNLNAGSSNTPIDMYLTYIGKLTDESIAIVDEIIGISDENVIRCENSNSYWSYANPETHPIKIKSITFSQLNKKLKNKIVNSFEDYVLAENGLDGLATWSTSNKTDGYYYGT